MIYFHPDNFLTPESAKILRAGIFLYNSSRFSAFFFAFCGIIFSGDHGFLLKEFLLLWEPVGLEGLLPLSFFQH
jgi:hypothetical protein